ncbi:unnamed protein product [Rotaria sordida]|uniref:Uncharacterized protein n=1 Tax=Rotaria sordida TaxID=392033 RepID=A0A815X7E7_9BILA|nr:unnamed protein product [Rotaria sordida]CAF1524521.1 unnamed protein product [Rotaria sordida]CAF1536692.1 unnamed protein product [Rotaria sordida]CAF1553132.1 unnamed protein product [Rotaria sordida]CAF1667750.1 unnamed protein product [Rotaria sordida]
MNKILKKNFLENVESTIKCRHQFESEMNLLKSGVSYTYLSGENSFYENRSYESNTPGVILPEQMINKCSSRKELSYFDHQSTVIRLVNILLDIGKTILIDEIVRIDVKHISNNARTSPSLMTTSRLPINVIQTKDVEQFYEQTFEKNQLGVGDLL